MKDIKKKDIRIAENTFSYISHFIHPSDEVLDLGSGQCLVADLIQKRITDKIKCIDVIDINKSTVPLSIFDGQYIPFPDNSFDVVLCNFVLHHTLDQEVLINEMKRTTRKSIIILEDTPENIIDRIFNLNHVINSKIKYKSKKMKFRKDEEWKALFSRLGLKLEQVIKIGKDRDPFYPTNRRVYVLNKNAFKNL
jgi:ubiquinone/menaquinone biosynthesis C-methylase UbiE